MVNKYIYIMYNLIFINLKKWLQKQLIKILTNFQKMTYLVN